MRFLQRRQSQPAPAADPDEPTSTLHQVAVFRAQGVTEGWVEPRADRLSDALNAGTPLLVRPSPDEDGRWEAMPADEMIAVAVSPSPRPSPRRIARRRHAIELVAPPYTIIGTAHMPPGADPYRYARSAPRQWLALTEATVAFKEEVIEVEILVVNLEHVRRP